MKYAKHLDSKNRRENWKEIIDRNKFMHISKFPELSQEIEDAYKFVYDKKILPSMRAIEDSTPILTINGWTTVGKIVPGDIIYDSRGKPTTVLRVKHFTDKNLYNIQFTNGASIVACDEHLWIVSTEDDRRENKTRVVDTQYIKTHLAQGDKNNISIRNTLPLEFEQKLYVIDPYILGVWLGDGFSNGTQFAVNAGSDAEYMKAVYEHAGYSVRKAGAKNIYAWNVVGLKPALNECKLIKNKHIPEEYLFGNSEQRIALLAGLMDTDGHITLSGRCLFTNTNIRIIDGVKFILSSLGIKYTTGIPRQKMSHHKLLYTISFFTDLPVVRMPRKLKNLRTPTIRNQFRKIDDVTPVGIGNASCFIVNSPDNSFLVGSELIVTHNSLQFAGKPTEINNTRIYNCSFMPMDHYAAFSELMFLLLSGTGVGYSVQQHHVEKLPEITRPTKTKRYLVGDSIEGWSDAVKMLVKAYFTGKAAPAFDFSDIRPKGARLITAGGKAPGPEPLKDGLHSIQKIFDRKQSGDKLTTLEVHDICCYIAGAVLSGGIRRSAMIALFDLDDDDMLTCKFGPGWDELNPQRHRANNSAVILRHKIDKEVFFDLWKKLEAGGTGEPGLFFTNDKEWGLNPCAEISLRAFQFCNLVTINTTNLKDQEDLNARAEAAAFVATLQASYTNFHYLRDIWKKTTEKEALIGVSMTGIASGAVLKLSMKDAAHAVKEENERVAKLIGINSAARCTTVKPEGCLTLDTVIRTTDGNKTMAELISLLTDENVFEVGSGVWIEPKSDVFVYNENDDAEKITKLYVNGMSEVYEITMEDGFVAKLTSEHRLKTTTGWKRVKDLNKDDEIIGY